MGLIMRSYRQPIIPPFHHSIPPTSYQRWKYQVITRMKKAHREKKWRFSKSHAFLKKYPYFASVLNKLWKITWYVYIGASLLDPRFSVQYIGRYTKRAVMAEYRIMGELRSRGNGMME